MTLQRRRLVGAALLRVPALSAAALAGCTLAPDADHDGDDASRALPLARAVRTAWVLSSGGPRGFAHVGVLRALDELGLVPDLIVGASVGALVGGLRAAGRSAADIEFLALTLNVLSVARLALGSAERLSGAPVAELMRECVPQQRIERLPVALACVAARRRDAVATAFTAGDIGLAVQASAAIEGRLTPVRIRGEAYVDADWVAPLPVRIARGLGAARVLAVDASVHLDRAPAGAARYREGDLKKEALVAADARHADLVIKPDFGYWVSFSRDFRERAIAAGYRDTMAQAERLRALHRG
ncbi:MAG: patatin-like phospholipase family protein [Burkholderiales bacterium]|nr:patatin-like phospholipase family protein [Burkholderiales bacterium]